MGNSISLRYASAREHLLFNERDNNLEHMKSQLNNIHWGDLKKALEDVRGILQSYHSNKDDWNIFCKSKQEEGYSTNEIIVVPDKYTLMLMVWKPLKGNFIHDHCGSQGLVKILQGRLVEEHYSYDKEKEKGKRLKNENEITLECNAVNDHNCFKDFHRMYNPDANVVAVSLHVYAPPLETCRIINKESNVTEIVQMKYASRRGEMTTLTEINELSADSNPVSLGKKKSRPVSFLRDIIQKLDQLNWKKQKAELKKDIRQLLEGYDASDCECEWSKHCTISMDEEYSRTIIHNSTDFTLFLYFYRPGADSLPHEHDGADCIYKVLEGQLEDKHFKVNEFNGDLELVGKPKTHVKNEVNSTEGSDDYHSNRNPSNEEHAVTLNVFTSHDVKCRVFEPESKSSYDIGPNFHTPDGLRRRKQKKHVSNSEPKRPDPEHKTHLIPNSEKRPHQNDHKHTTIQTNLRIAVRCLPIIALVFALTAIVIIWIKMNGNVMIFENSYNFHIQNNLLGNETNTIQFSPVTVHIKIYSQDKSSAKESNYECCYQAKFEQNLDYNKKPRGVGIFERSFEIYISGWYYIYSSMTLVPPNKKIPINQTQESTFHYVDRISPLNATNSGRLLRAVHTNSQLKTMYSGGIFHFQKGDKLKVSLSRPDIEVVSESSHFGMVMLVSTT